MFLVSLAESFIHLFQAAGKIFLDMMTGLIPMLICLLLAINFLMKLVGTSEWRKLPPCSAARAFSPTACCRCSAGSL